MSSTLHYKEDILWLSNRRFRTLTEFAAEIAEQCVLKPLHREYVQEWQRKLDVEFFPGCMLNLEEAFPSLEEQQFWCRVFFDLGRAVFLREIGNQDIGFWQTRVIHLAITVADWLLASVREQVSDWSPNSKNAIKESEFYRNLNESSEDHQ